MSAWNDDPLLDRIRALPRPELDARLDDHVHFLAMAALSPAPRRPRQLVAAALVASAVLVYFGWAVAFVVLPRL